MLAEAGAGAGAGAGPLCRPAGPHESLEREADLAVTPMDTGDFAEGIAASRPSGLVII